MALKLRMKPREKAIINGAVIENGGRTTELIVHNFAQILREPDVMQEDEATTPSKRCYFAAQLMIIDSQNGAQHKAMFDSLLNDLRGAFIKPVIHSALDEAALAVAEGNHYKALRALKNVIAYEESLLNPR